MLPCVSVDTTPPIVKPVEEWFYIRSPAPLGFFDHKILQVVKCVIDLDASIDTCTCDDYTHCGGEWSRRCHDDFWRRFLPTADLEQRRTRPNIYRSNLIPTCVILGRKPCMRSMSEANNGLGAVIIKQVS